jgi:hypothetical protein
MTDYVKSTNFASKDSLSTGNPLKIIKGTEFDTEFNNIATSVATKADSSSVTSNLALKAPLADPTFTGIPAAPTASVNTNTTQLANTAFVVAQIADDAPTKTGGGASGTWGINITGNAATATNATNAANASTVTTITTTQVLNATAGASVGAVGTYAFLGLPYGSYGTAMPGATASGSTLRYSSSLGFDSGGTPSGTWRCMGFMTFTSDGGGGYSTAYSTLWLRIS